MLIYRLAQAKGDEKSKELVQLSSTILTDDGQEAKQVIIRLPKLVFLQMAITLEQNALPYNKIEESK